MSDDLSTVSEPPSGSPSELTDDAKSKWTEPLKGISGCLLYLLITVGIGALIVALFRGMGWISENLFPWTNLAASIAVIVIVPVSLLLAIPRKTRGIASLGLVIASYIIGLGLWVWSLLLAYSLAGVFWLGVGLFLAGIGVVPVAFIAAIFHGEWLVAAQILVLAIIVYGVRFLGTHLAESVKKRKAKERLASFNSTLSEFNDASHQLAARLNNLGLDYLRQERSNHAIQAFEEAIENSAKNDVWYEEKTAEVRDGEIDRNAAVDLSEFELNVSETMQERRLDRAKIQYNLANAYSKGRYDLESIDALREAVRLQPDSGLFHYALGLRCQFAGEYQEAIDECKLLLSLGEADLAKELATYMDQYSGEDPQFFEDEEYLQLAYSLIARKFASL